MFTLQLVWTLLSLWFPLLMIPIIALSLSSKEWIGAIFCIILGITIFAIGMNILSGVPNFNKECTNIPSFYSWSTIKSIYQWNRDWYGECDIFDNWVLKSQITNDKNDIGIKAIHDFTKEPMKASYIFWNSTNKTTIVNFIIAIITLIITAVIVEKLWLVQIIRNQLFQSQKIPSAKNEEDEVQKTIDNSESEIVLDETPDGKYIISNGKRYLKSLVKKDWLENILKKNSKQ